ncbi:MAG TPA: HlyD family efflux transporter periplasmic adaptor subunit [Longimicrobiales bacterium]
MDIPREKPKNRRRYFYVGGGLAAVVLTTVALSRLEPAAPTVERATIWTDTVQRGTMVREVRGPGKLVPERIQWISTLTPGRVERILAEPGMEVTRETVLLELSNPDVNIQALGAEQQLTAARATLVSLRTQLETQRLNQEAMVATAESAYREALRNVETNRQLAKEGLIAPNELARSQDQAEEFKTKLEIERKRLEILSESVDDQLAVQQAQVDRLRAVAEFQRAQVEAMHVRAGADGVLQELPLEVGQWVTPGMTLAKVVQPGRLKAELRIPETQAKDVAIGQKATIDTRNSLIKGHVSRIDPAVQDGTVTVDVALDEALPPGARPDLSVDGTIEIERLDDVLFVGRPGYGQPESTVGLFKVVDDGDAAIRVNVRLGRASVNTIEVREGLQVGDIVILSDMSAWDAVDRVRLR